MAVSEVQAENISLDETARTAIYEMMAALAPLHESERTAVISGLLVFAKNGGGSPQSYWHPVRRAAPLFSGNEVDEVCRLVDLVVDLINDQPHIRAWILANLVI